MVLLADATALSEPTPEQAAFFESKVRPLLVANCQDCHGEDEANANLRLDSIGAILGGGDSGPVVVPGKPENSLMMKAVSYNNAQLQMPPDDKLGDEQIATLKQWIAMGAPWPGADPAVTPQTPRKEFQITDEDRAWWAFQPLPDQESQIANRKSQIAEPIYAFILDKLSANGIAPNSPAGKRELIRRATFDLIGLPPTPEDVDAFVADNSPDAYPKLIDRLLASPHYGERWARHWLDVVRFAQSNGYERDDEKPEIWRYRDYVVRAFNDDKPYDQFIREQLAGDELAVGRISNPSRKPAETPSTEDGLKIRATGDEYDSLIATGFYRLGVCDDEPDDKQMAVFDDLDDIVTTTSHAFLGLTINCARCHDHKFDPIAQADYYSFLAFFRNIRRYEAPKYAPDSVTLAPLAKPETMRAWQDATSYALAELQSASRAEPDAKIRSKLDQQARTIENKKANWGWAMVVTENGSTAPATQILTRGNAATPTIEVQPAFPQVISPEKPQLPARAPDSKTTGRRGVLADWIANPNNPLTARVMVNRLWQHHFGRGIVPTPNDFGRTGMKPTHPELLDWLASEFIRNGWSIKHMHRTIMLSATYRQSAQADNPPGLAADQGNSLLWRQNLRRVQAEVMRDAMLAVSGQLDAKVGGPRVFLTLPPEVLATQSRPGNGWKASPPQEQRRRSIYIFVKRSLLVPLMENFDYTNTAFPVGERPTTTVAPQALMLLNNTFVREQAAALANRVTRESGDDPTAKIHNLFRRTLQRLPTNSEREIAIDVLGKQRTAHLDLLALESGSRDPTADSAEAGNRALRSLCLMMLNLNEFLYID